MTLTQRRLIEALARCRFATATWDKKFSRSMANLAAADPGCDLSGRQHESLCRLVVKYRRQLAFEIETLARQELEALGMDEKLWSVCTDPVRMLDWLTSQPGDSAPHHDPVRPVISARKFRLFAVACCRDVWGLIHEEGRSQIRFAELAADEVTVDPAYTLGDQWKRQYLERGQRRRKLFTGPGWNTLIGSAADAARLTAQAVRGNVAGFHRLNRADEDDMGAFRECASRQADLLRDLIGNPFNPLTWSREDENWVYENHLGINPAWKTLDVVSLATVIYAERKWDELSVLADALEDAGCSEPRILEHLRGTICPHCKDADFRTGDYGGPLQGGDRMRQHLMSQCVCKGTRRVLGVHVRGCWVLDLITGRA